jgi:hypothetical protein
MNLHDSLLSHFHYGKLKDTGENNMVTTKNIDCGNLCCEP